MNLASWLKIIEKAAPIVLAATPLAPLAPFVAVGIQAAEQIPGATGPQKLTIATQLVNTGIAATNAQAGKQVINPSEASQLVASGINAVVAAANLESDINAAAPGTQPVIEPTE